MIIGGSMIETIEINIRNGVLETINALIIFKKNICYINNKKYIITEEFKNSLLNEILCWKNEYGSDEINIDSEEFTIKINTSKCEERYHGKGIFPYNYTYFKELLGAIYE